MPGTSSLYFVCLELFSSSYGVAQLQQTSHPSLPDSPDVIITLVSDMHPGPKGYSSSFVRLAQIRCFLRNRRRKSSSPPPRTLSTTPRYYSPPHWQAIRWQPKQPGVPSGPPPAMAAIFGTAMPTDRSRTTRLSSSCRHLRMKASGIRRWTKAVSLSELAMHSAASSSPGPMLELQPSTVAKSSALAQPLAYLISTIPQANVPSATQPRNGALMFVWMLRPLCSKSSGRISTMLSFVPKTKAMANQAYRRFLTSLFCRSQCFREDRCEQHDSLLQTNQKKPQEFDC